MVAALPSLRFWGLSSCPLSVGALGRLLGLLGRVGRCEKAPRRARGHARFLLPTPGGGGKTGGRASGCLYHGGGGHLRVFRGMQKGQGISVPGLCSFSFGNE
jgi:hypothetical protein